MIFPLGVQLIMSLLAVWWWLRSPDYSGTDDFQNVYTDGNNNNNNANYCAGVRPGFLQIYTVKCSNRRQTAFQVKDDRCKRSCTSLGFNP